MQDFGSYTIIIAGSIIVILSYIFNIISRKTSIPSVLLFIIIATSLAMTISLVKAKNRQKMNISFPESERKEPEKN